MIKTVPIYSADIILNRVSLTGPAKKTRKILDTIKLENVVVKGFSIKNIIERKKLRLADKAHKVKKLGKDQFYEVIGIELLKQHGYGVND